VGSGISGGWVAKELIKKKDLKLLEREIGALNNSSLQR
jgi:hypothetical protein